MKNFQLPDKVIDILSECTLGFALFAKNTDGSIDFVCDVDSDIDYLGFIEFIRAWVSYQHKTRDELMELLFEHALVKDKKRRKDDTHSANEDGDEEDDEDEDGE